MSDTQRASKLRDTDDAAEYLGKLSPRTLARWRQEGKGPAYVQLGRRTFYHEDALDEFIGSHTVRPAR